MTLSRAITDLGIYPAVDPLDSSSANIVGQEHYDTARGVQETLQPPSSAWTNSPRRTSPSSTAPGRCSSSSRSRCSWPSSSPAVEDGLEAAHDVLAGDGDADDLPQQACYMVGTIEDAREKAKTLS